METPQDKDAWIAAMTSAGKNTIMDHFGIELLDIGDDHIELKMPITDAARQPLGLLHGGVSMVLAETAASYHACWGYDLTTVQPVGIEINGTHLRSAREGTVKTVGKVIRRARKFVFHQVDMYLIETDEHLSTARVTNYYRKV